MAKAQKRTRKAPAEQSKAEQRARQDERRVRRELAAVQRVRDLSRRLETAAARAELSTFQLGRALVTEKGWSVVKDDVVRILERENTELRDRITELERQANVQDAQLLERTV